MNRSVFLGFASALLLTQAATVAQAASPHLSGTYMLHFTGLCQAIQEKAASPSPPYLTTLQGGGFTQTVGTMRFTPSALYGQSGSMSATYTIVDGAALVTVVQGVYTYPPGTRMTIATTTRTGTYSLTASSITVKFSGDASQNYRAYFGQLGANGLAKRMEFVTLVKGTPPGIKPVEEDCSEAGTLELR